MIVKFAHLIDVDEDTVNKRNIESAKVIVGCNSSDAVPRELHAASPIGGAQQGETGDAGGESANQAGAIHTEAHSGRDPIADFF